MLLPRDYASYRRVNIAISVAIVSHDACAQWFKRDARIGDGTDSPARDIEQRDQILAKSLGRARGCS